MFRGSSKLFFTTFPLKIFQFFNTIETIESNSVCKYVSDFPELYCNSKMKRMIVDEKVHIWLFATMDVPKEIEIKLALLTNT